MHLVRRLFREADIYYRMSNTELEREGQKYNVSCGLASGTIDRECIIRQLLRKDEVNNSKFAVRISILSLLASIVIFPVSFYLNLLQIQNLSKSDSSRDVGLMREFKKDLNSGANSLIYEAVLSDSLILKENGGSFSKHELNQYLSLFTQLYSTYAKELISGPMVWAFFYDSITKTYNNNEIRAYLYQLRKEDPSWYLGLDILTRYVTEYENDVRFIRKSSISGSSNKNSR